MKKKIKVFVIVFLLGFTYGKSQNVGLYRSLNLSSNHNYEQHALNISNRGNAFQFMHLRRYLGANNALIEKGANRDKVIAHQWQLIDNVLRTAKISKNIPNSRSRYKDNYQGWLSLSQTTMLNQEVMLYEGYAFFYIAQFLYITKKNGWSETSVENKRKWENLLSFVEKNVWTKWADRSSRTERDRYYYFLGRRTHMGSHWAGIGLYLKNISTNQNIVKEATTLVSKYDVLLRRNMRNKGGGFIWNSTYDDITGIHVFKAKDDIVQDISHGNHVVSYIVAAYEAQNNSWTLEDLRKISYSLTTFAYDAKRKSFRNNVDGSVEKPQSGNANFMGDGWSKLAKYDNNVKFLMNDFGKTKYITNDLQELQFRANLLGLD